MRSTEGRPSPIHKLIAASYAELSWLYAALADPDQDSEPGTPEGGVKEREISSTELSACIDAGTAAQKACHEAGGTIEGCYAVGRIAEAACLESILKAPKEVKDQ